MRKRYWITAIVTVLAMLMPLLPGCSCSNNESAYKEATAYTAIVPAVLQAGITQAVSIALLAGAEPAAGQVSLSLQKDGKTVSQASQKIVGNGSIQLEVPAVEAGEYTLVVKGETFEDSAAVRVENSLLVFLESDKPIYKPGQTIFVRVMTLDSELRPAAQSVDLEVLDAKGLKIFRTEVTTDDYGMTTVELPVSAEPNLGTWKIKAGTARSETELDVKVEEYVLPKYEVTVDLPREWFLVSEPVQGVVSATYSFGKAVKGEVSITAQKYVGTWETYAKLELDIDGSAEFEIPAANYVAGVPGAQGNGNVKLEIEVEESATGYVEKTDRLLTVTEASVNLTLIPASVSYKPGLPFSFLVVSETPDNQLVDTSLSAEVTYLDEDYSPLKTLNLKGDTSKGKRVFDLTPPEDSIAMTLVVTNGSASVTRNIAAAYSPTGNFINLEQTTEGELKVGGKVKFWVYSTAEATRFYYEIISRGQVVYSSYTENHAVEFTLTPAMAPAARLLVYQVLPNSEVAADYLPFEVTADYPQSVSLDTGVTQAEPGQEIEITIQTEGQSEVGLAAVDKSVFILAENRMNLQQVFDQLEALYMDPQAELHEISMYEDITNRGAQEVFETAGVIVLSNNRIPEGKTYESPFQAAMLGGGGDVKLFVMNEAPQMQWETAAAAPAPVVRVTDEDGAELAEVQRVRQFFPETWLWQTVQTDTQGRATINATVPDSITTWMLRAVALSQDSGLGISESQLTVFQPFFLSIDLPYSAIRGEEFPVSAAIYNYLDETQEVQLEIEDAEWFDLLDEPVKSVSIDANEIGSVRFNIRPRELGVNQSVNITARSPQAADAVIKTLIIEPEGVAQEAVENLRLSAGEEYPVETIIPYLAVDGSGRVYLAVTAGFLTQTMDGLDSLIQMPFGCGEQNMIIFAPDVYITRYLQASGQLKPEIMAKAEKLMLTGYQRELTYRRSDNSFSAFGQNDAEGSLWLTAFVLKCFSEAKGLIYIDDELLEETSDWILSHQAGDGSFESVGFVHHQEMLGGIQGKTALTAYVAIALATAGESAGAGRAAAYLESQLDGIEDAYTLAITACALQMTGSAAADRACEQLLQMAEEDENGLYWGSEEIGLLENNAEEPAMQQLMREGPTRNTSAIEATAYATLALVKQGDSLNASRAATWLIAQRNASGGYGSTQDTVMALQAITEFSSGAAPDLDLKVTVQTPEGSRELSINESNYDVLQIIDLPANSDSVINVTGRGEAMAQIVRRYNLPEAPEEVQPILTIDVRYDSREVEVNDEVLVSVDLAFNPQQNIEAGMTVVDIAVPTGFAADSQSIEEMISHQPLIKRYDISGRKVILYLENLLPGERLLFDFKVRALYPVKAKGVNSQAYSYYQPDISAQSLSEDITIR